MARAVTHGFGRGSRKGRLSIMHQQSQQLKFQLHDKLQKLHVAQSKHLPKNTILVIGDVMLDTYLQGVVERISPEAPVPVHRLRSKKHVAGGAANVALNVLALGASPVLIGVIGQDDEGHLLKDILTKQGCSTEFLLSTPERMTTSKTRVVAGGHQIVRIDSERDVALTQADVEQLFLNVQSAVSQTAPRAAILSDYAKGVLSEGNTRALISYLNSQKIPVFVDPKSKDFSKYSGAFGICPNRSELYTALGIGLAEKDEDKIISLSQQLRQKHEFQNLFYTRSEEGLSILNDAGHTHWPATAREVVDVSGAGDTIIAALATMICAGFTVPEAAFLANTAAGIEVQKWGSYAVTLSELIREVAHGLYTSSAAKVFAELDSLVTLIESWKSLGEKVVFTNGCFDLFHYGHLTLLEKCKQLGDRLVVAVNSDASVGRLKGPSRPHVSEYQRTRILSGLEVVDAVYVFAEDTPLQVIEALKPHVLAKGGDYSVAEVVGKELVESAGGRVEIISLVPGISTTLLSQKISARKD